MPYVGLVASHKRGAGVLAELRADGVPEEQLERIDVPAGLDIGARTPAEIALVDPRDRRRRAPRKRTARRRRPADAQIALASPAPTLAVDPICGMTVAAVASTPSRASTTARRSTSAARAARPSSRRSTSMRRGE